MARQTQSPSPAQRSARRIAAIFATLAALWIIGAHQINDWLTSSDRMHIVGHIIASVILVLLTTVAIYWLIRRDLQKLERSEQRFRDLFESSQDALLVIDDRERCVDANRAAAWLLGRPVRDLRGQPIAALFAATADDGAETTRLASSAPDSLAARLRWARTADGRHVPVEATVSTIQHTNGAGRLLMVRDITERRRAEQQLRASEESYRLLFERNPYPMWVYDVETLRFLAVNDAAIAHYGYSRDEFLRMTIADLRPAEDVPALLRWLAEQRQAYRQASIWRHRKKDGTVIDVEVSSHSFEFESRPARLVLALDVTERKRTEERLTTLVNKAPVILFALDAGGVFTLVQGRMLQQMGVTGEEVVGQSIFEVYRERPDITAHVRRALNGQEHTSIDHTLNFVFETRWTPLFDPDGQVAGVIGVATDVTERKAAEEALRRSEATNRGLLDALPDLMFRLSRDGRFLDYRVSDRHKLLVPPEAFIGRNVTDVFPPWLAHQAQEAITHAFATGEMQLFEYELEEGNSPGFYEARLVVSGDDEVLAIIRDISDRKRAERVLRDARDVYLTLVEEAPMLVWRTDMSGHCTFVNKQWIAFTGRAPEGSLLDSLGDPLHPEDRESFQQAFLQAIVERRTFEVEARLRRQDGAYRWMVIRGSPFFDDRGAAAGYISTAIDITDRKQQERAKDDFLALASHELKTPLAALVGYIHLLQRWTARDTADDRSRQALQAMAAEGERLDRLINDLLDVSRIQTGRLRLDRQPTDLRYLLGAVVEKLRVAITTHELILQNSHDAPIIAPVDAGRIEQVIANLVTNATKYSAPLSPILISLRAMDDRAEIDVIDHGIGIPVADLEHIFDRFYQVQRPARESRPGLGLGLFIAREIARQHGGEITVRSHESRGSQFTLQLPLVQPAEECHDVERITHLST